MDAALAHLLAQSKSVAEMLTGAYGYLAASVDNYLHSETVTTADLKKDFDAIQQAVVEALHNHFKSTGVTMHDFALGIAESANDFGLSPEQTSTVVRNALDYVFPLTPVTKP